MVRNLKLSNIYLKETSNLSTVKIVDFALAAY